MLQKIKVSILIYIAFRLIMHVLGWEFGVNLPPFWSWSIPVILSFIAWNWMNKTEEIEKEITN